MTEDRERRIGRDPRHSFSAEANRMQRYRRRFMIVFHLTVFAIAFVLCWLLVHPETIGAFLGRIAAGFRDGAR